MDDQNVTFQIKEECNLQWDNSPGDVQINEENVNFEKYIVIADDQNQLGEMDSGYKHVHRDEYKCDICGKTFSQVDRLTTHIMTQIGEKPHTCKICGKTFTQSNHLKQHILTHTGENPHKCDICEKAFILLSNLK